MLFLSILTLCRPSLTSVLSINAAISASVVLASRLPDDISVFALMLCAVVLFAMFPVLRHRLQVRVAIPPLGIMHGAASYRPGRIDHHLFERPSRTRTCKEPR